MDWEPIDKAHRRPPPVITPLRPVSTPDVVAGVQGWPGRRQSSFQGFEPISQRVDRFEDQGQRRGRHPLISYLGASVPNDRGDVIIVKSVHVDPLAPQPGL
jgi:hypothetical protein